MSKTPPKLLEIDEVSDELVKFIYDDGTENLAKVIKLETRLEAINLAEKLTRQALQHPDAFDHLDRYANDFKGMRNYEIEGYLDELKTDDDLCYRINELCPYNGFKWFDQ